MRHTEKKSLRRNKKKETKKCLRKQSRQTFQRKKEPQEKKVKRNRTAKKCGETAESEKKEKQSLLQKIKYTYQTMCDKIKVLLEKKEKLTEFLAEPIHKAAWGRLKKELFRILRLLRPRKFTGAVRFGLEDPYDTGRILAVLSMLYPFYGEHIDIYPDFEYRILEGHLLIKGRIRGIYAVIVLWNLFLINRSEPHMNI